MTWVKPFIAIILFYFSAVLQNSFFAHFVFLGASLNLVFIFFFLFVFFEKQAEYFLPFLYAIIGGFFSDVFSPVSLGISIILFIIIAFLIKKIQSLLKEEKDNYPLIYFSPLFLLSFASYSLLFQAFLFPPTFQNITLRFDWSFIIEIIYNSLFAILIFYIYKRYIKLNDDNRQLNLFFNK